MFNRRQLLGTMGAATVAAAFRTNITAMEQAIDQAILENRIVGCVVLVIERGREIFAKAAGHADLEQQRPMTLQTPFRYSSVSKPFTTMAALKLIEAGRLAPEDPVHRWLPWFRPRMIDGTEALITVDDLMSHMAGLDYGFQQPETGSYARAGISDGLDASSVTLRENARKTAEVPLDWLPGTKWRYSVATDVLGAVIEAVAGKSLQEAMRDLVTGPLELDAAFDWQADDLAVPYFDGDPAPIRMSGPTALPLPFPGGGAVKFDPSRIRNAGAFPSGGAGMAGRAQDVARLLEAYRSGPFLPDGLRLAAITPRIGEEAMTQGPGWGFSWMGAVLENPDAAGSLLSPGTISWGGVYGHWWAVDFERERVIVSLTNTAFEGMSGRFAQDMART